VAEATRDAERERYRAQAESIRRELAAALDEVAQRRVSLQRYRAAVLPSLDAHERLLGIAAQGGQIDVVAVLRAEDAILRSRSEFVAIRRAHHQAWLRLDRAVGRRVAAEAAPVASPQRPSAPKGP
jgi:outer membrane protein TolC